LPEIARWQRRAKDVTIALVSKGTVDENRQKASEHGVADVLVQGDVDIAKLYDVQGTPTAILVARDGTLGSAPAPGQFAIEALVAPLLAPEEQRISRKKLFGGALVAAATGVATAFPGVAQARSCAAPRVKC